MEYIVLRTLNGGIIIGETTVGTTVIKETTPEGGFVNTQVGEIKTFTQDELNEILTERLSKAERKTMRKMLCK